MLVCFIDFILLFQLFVSTVLEGLDCCEQLASTLALTLAVTAAAHPLQLRGTLFTVCGASFSLLT